MHTLILTVHILAGNSNGISPLQWCLRFLLGLKNSQGEYTGDVEICIQAIQDDLIEQYAKLGMALEKSMEEESERKTKSGKVPVERGPMKENNDETTRITREFVHENEPRVLKEENDSTNFVEGDPIDSTNNQQGDLGVTEETFAPILKRETQLSSEHVKNDRKYLEENCDPMRCGTSEVRKKKEETVSFTYNEMVSRGPAPCTEEYSIEDLFDESIIDKTNEELNKNEDLPRMNLADTSKMVYFLNSSRQQHIERIKKEIERLYGLERFMEHLNANGFSAYVTEDLARRMEHWKNEDVIKDADELIR